MKLIFLGTPQAVVTLLEQIYQQAPVFGHELLAVVSQPARPVGRKGILTDPPVAAFSKDKGIPVLQPEKASDPNFLEALQDLQPDVMITAAYGQILTEQFLSIPKRATINIHPSLLPQFRGATPVPAALLAGMKETGVSILFTVKKLDAGAIIVQERFNISPKETAGELTERLFTASGDLLFKALDTLKDASFTGYPQDEDAVTFCHKIKKEDGLIDWQRDSRTILNRFRAFYPWPGSYTYLHGKRVHIHAMSSGDQTHPQQQPGTFTYHKASKAIVVHTGQGDNQDTIHIGTLQNEGGKVIDAASFWNGLKDKSHLQFQSKNVERAEHHGGKPT